MTDEAADVTDAQLPGDLVRGLQIGLVAVVSMSPPRVARAELISSTPALRL